MKASRHSVLDVTDCRTGGAENDGHENDGPSKCAGMKLTDMKMPDMFQMSE